MLKNLARLMMNVVPTGAIALVETGGDINKYCRSYSRKNIGAMFIIPAKKEQEKILSLV